MQIEKATKPYVIKSQTILEMKLQIYKYTNSSNGELVSCKSNSVKLNTKSKEIQAIRRTQHLSSVT